MNPFFLSVLLIFLLALTSQCKEVSPFFGYKEKQLFVSESQGVNLRQKPSMEGGEIELLPYGESVQFEKELDTMVEVKGKTGKWIAVKHAGKVGWVFGGFLQTQPPAGKNRTFHVSASTDWPSSFIGIWISPSGSDIVSFSPGGQHSYNGCNGTYDYSIGKIQKNGENVVMEVYQNDEDSKPFSVDLSMQDGNLIYNGISYERLSEVPGDEEIVSRYCSSQASGE